MTLEEAKEIKEDSKIVMSCLNGKPNALVIKNTPKDSGIIVQTLDRESSILLVLPEHLVRGADSTIQAIDFKEEIKIPNGEDMPSFIKRAVIELGEINSNLTHTRIGNNISQYRMDVKNPNAKDMKPFTGNVGLEMEKRIHAETDCSGAQTAIMAAKGGGLGMAFISVAPYHVFESIKSMMASGEFPHIAFTIKEDNHELDDTVKIPDCDYFQKIYMKTNGTWWYGILPIKCVDKKPVFGPIDWANDTWTERMELDIARADIIEKFMDYGTAFDGKINITKYVETDAGWFYEGNINEKKIDPKLQDFLRSINLSVNDRKLVNEKLTAMGKGIKMQKDNAGFITVRAGSYFATDRRSKTRAYIEALENIVQNM